LIAAAAFATTIPTSSATNTPAVSSNIKPRYAFPSHAISNTLSW